jgi:hypothetical protein
VNLLNRLIKKMITPTRSELLPKDLLPNASGSTLRQAFEEDRLLRNWSSSRRTA